MSHPKRPTLLSPMKSALPVAIVCVAIVAQGLGQGVLAEQGKPFLSSQMRNTSLLPSASQGMPGSFHEMGRNNTPSRAKPITPDEQAMLEGTEADSSDLVNQSAGEDEKERKAPHIGVAATVLVIAIVVGIIAWALSNSKYD